MKLPKYSIGIGDRFAHQGLAQLDAFILAQRMGVEIAPVWNKSHREHATILSHPQEVRAEADNAVQSRKWTTPYFVDADHISIENVDLFLEASNFFTIDVADWIGVDASDEEINAFVTRNSALLDLHSIPGIERPISISKTMMAETARKFLMAIRQARQIFNHIQQGKNSQRPVIEVSLDETDQPQTPLELLLILLMISEENIPAQTIAPRFVGRFNKGVEYVGDASKFKLQFEEDLAVIDFAIKKFHLPENLKLSVHSGSDKFAIYGPIHQAMRKFDAGIHLKTAGTTWLEELIGLAIAGGNGLEIAKEVYRQAWERFDELCSPYATVIDIHRDALPLPGVVARWDGNTFASTLRHDATCVNYNPHFRQLMHVGYKVAAEMGDQFTALLQQHVTIIANNVTHNLYQRHIRPLFFGS